MGTPQRDIRQQTRKLAVYGSNTGGSVVQTGPARALPPSYNVYILIYLGWPFPDIGAVAWGHHLSAIHLDRLRQRRATDHLPGSTRNPRYRREKSRAAGYRRPDVSPRSRQTRRLEGAARR
jgi:hypothetical protein